MMVRASWLLLREKGYFARRILAHAPFHSHVKSNPFAAAQFLTSCAKLIQLPPDALPEIAFAGRSNAGKSSALNAICQQRQLARVSKTPGRTQLINLFNLPGARLADLPGYGFADVPKPVREGWKRLVGGYLEGRENLHGLVLIMDIRRPLTDFDRQMLDWAHQRALACHILLSKADKLGYGAAKNQLLAVQKTLREAEALTTTVQTFSAHSGLGVEAARERCLALLGLGVPAA